MTLVPSAIDSGGVSHLHQERGHQNVGIENHAHQALSAFVRDPLARLSARASRTSLVDEGLQFVRVVPALRDLMS